MKKLTRYSYPKIAILKFIAYWTKKHNHPPTLKEIAKGLGYSAHSTIAQHLYEMGISWQKEKGRFVEKCPFCKRPY